METPLTTIRQFNRIRKYILVRSHAKRLDDIEVLSAIILVIRFGLAWRQLLEFYGKCYSIHCIFRSWSKTGAITKIFPAFSLKLQKRCTAMIDSTFSKAHRIASSMRPDSKDRAPVKSRGGITAKIHLLCTSDGPPMDFHITSGNVSEKSCNKGHKYLYPS